MSIRAISTRVLRVVATRSSGVAKSAFQNQTLPTSAKNTFLIAKSTRQFSYIVQHTREDIIKQALENVKTMGWSEEAVNDVLSKTGSKEKLTIADVAAHFMYYANLETLEELRKNPEFSTMSTRDQLVYAIKARLEKNAPYAQYSFDLFKITLAPGSALRGIASQFFMHDVWQIIQDTTPDQLYSSRKMLVMSAYSTAELAYANGNKDANEITKIIQQQVDNISNVNMDMFSQMQQTARSDPAKAEAAQKMLSSMLSAMEKAKGGNPLGAIKDMMTGPNAPSPQELQELMKMMGTQLPGAAGGDGILAKAKMMGEMFKSLKK